MVTTYLREQWKGLTPRERDAKVAKALGWTVAESIEQEAPEHLKLRCTRQGDSQATELHFLDGACWYETCPLGADILPSFSTLWQDAGPLLDQLREEGWEVGVGDDGEGWVAMARIRPSGTDLYARGCSGPEAMALAFCLAKEAK